MKHQTPNVRPTHWLAATIAFLIFTVMQTQAATNESINRTLDIAPGGTLVVKVENGRINVTGEAGSGVVIKIDRVIKASSKEKEEAFLAGNPVEIETSGNSVTITRKGEKGDSWGFSWFRKKPREEATYEIVVPVDFNLELKTSGGDIAVTNLKGKTRADTSGGSIRLINLTGDTNIHTSGGSIRINDCHGTTDAHTSGGSITTENGSGDLMVKTSGGSITVRDHNGNINGHTSGGSVSATFKTNPTQPCSLSTSGGSVNVTLPANAAVDLEASTSGGSVHSEFPDAQPDPKKRNKLSGPINGGGPDLKLQTSGGNIHIKRSGEA
ncbi:MAG: DUF4097 family beta strand repeat-containing protein [Opitutaceae bacterium]